MQWALLLLGVSWRGRVPEEKQPSLFLPYSHFHSLFLPYSHFHFQLESEWLPCWEAFTWQVLGCHTWGRLFTFSIIMILGWYLFILDNTAEGFWIVFGGGLLFGFLFSFALSTVIVCLRLTEISSTFQRNETKSKGLYHLSQTANRIMKSFQTVNGDCWHMICNKEICCFNLWLIGNAAANPRKERENL